MSVITYPGVVRNGKVESITPLDLPEGSEVYVVVPTTVTARMAKRKANGWLISYVGNMLLADNGKLLQREKEWIWRFEVFITSLTHKPRGPIGLVSLNATTGAILQPEQTKASLYHDARIAQRSL